MLQPNSKNNKILFFCDSLHTLDSTISQNTSLNIITGYRKNLLELGYNSHLDVFFHYLHCHCWTAFLSFCGEA